MPHSVGSVVMTISPDDPLTSHHHHPHHHQYYPFMNGTKSQVGSINGVKATVETPAKQHFGLPNGRPVSATTQCDGLSPDNAKTSSMQNGTKEVRTSLTKQLTVSTASGVDGTYLSNVTTVQQHRLSSATNTDGHSISTFATSIQSQQQQVSRPTSPSSHSMTAVNGTGLLEPQAQTNAPRLSSPPALGLQNTAPQATASGASTSVPSAPAAGNQLRHRHTLQVPVPKHGGRSPGGSDAMASGRFSPTSAQPRRASTTLGRRGSRSIQSDLHIDEIPQDDDAAKWAEAIKAKRASKRRKREDADDERVVVGTKVDQNHVNWVTAYNMLTGIRFVVSRVNAKMDRPLTDLDFEAKNKFSFDITGNELTPSAKYDFKFKDYAPWVFRHLRAKFGLDPADYLMSLTSKYILSELGSPGKSGSFFYFSRDYKYIIKTIHHGEHRFLRKILKDYYRHIEENPNTLISQFYGLHRVKTPFGRKIHFVVMNNLFPPHRDIHQTFDLKGSTIGRDYQESNLGENPRATLKDLNWLRRDMHLELGPSKKQIFLEQVEKDVRLLQRLEIMDYSLLIGIHDLTRGNKDDLRNNQLKVFQPGVENAGDAQQDTTLMRTPSRMESARKAREMRKIINKEVPVTLDRAAERLPDEYQEHKSAIFYRDDGGFRATHESDDPGEVIYYLGIIDCLTHYGMFKRIEHFLRSIQYNKDDVSAIPPVGYGERFLNFIRRVVKSPEEAAREKAERESQQALGGDAGDEESANRLSAQSAPEPERRITTIRSPSAERTNGATGTILPVVEETGEGSLGSRSRSHNDSAMDVTTHRERPSSSASNLDKPLPPRPDSIPPVPTVRQFSFVEKQTVHQSDLQGSIARVSS